jgi:large subunit ribosomal protein L23
MSAIFKKTEKKVETKKVVKEKPAIKVAEKPKFVEKKLKPINENRVKMGWRAIKSPHITEKAGFLEGKNQFSFKVFDNANKSEIKKAVEEIYKVNVIKVTTINVRPKERRKGRIKGQKSGYKKAIVSLKAGQKIEILPR